MLQCHFFAASFHLGIEAGADENFISDFVQLPPTGMPLLFKLLKLAFGSSSSSGVFFSSKNNQESDDDDREENCQGTSLMGILN